MEVLVIMQGGCWCFGGGSGVMVVMLTVFNLKYDSGELD